ncbi:RHS repeat-associated core domain-containing protein [Chryseobacterium sp. StRB126]|nr:RHS repeat-associated core domain-containing protein [Chryseobacterium sp. StRB126]
MSVILIGDRWSDIGNTFGAKDSDKQSLRDPNEQRARQNSFDGSFIFLLVHCVIVGT